MAKYQVELSDEFGFEVDFPPGAPAPKDLEVGFEAHTERELRDLVRMLGFDASGMNPSKSLHVRWRVPVTRDGEAVSSCDVHLWLGGELTDEAPAVPPIPVLERIVGDAVTGGGQ